jgi:hypothetical protein
LLTFVRHIDGRQTGFCLGTAGLRAGAQDDLVPELHRIFICCCHICNIFQMCCYDTLKPYLLFSSSKLIRCVSSGGMTAVLPAHPINSCMTVVINCVMLIDARVNKPLNDMNDSSPLPSSLLRWVEVYVSDIHGTFNY